MKPSDERKECPRCHQMRLATSFTISYVPNICQFCYEKWCGACGTINDHVLSESPCVECGRWTYAGWDFATEEEMEDWADHEFD
jgi:hypothetical protein